MVQLTKYKESKWNRFNDMIIKVYFYVIWISLPAQTNSIIFILNQLKNK